MEKKFKFSDKNAVSKIVYLTVIAILCVSAIVIGIVAANSRKKTEIPETPPVTDVPNNDGNTNDGETQKPSDDKEEKPTAPTLIFVSPITGTVIKSHSSTVPVFSNTLDEWRIHTGLDISADDGAEVCSAANGEVTKIYNDPMLGQTVEITHSTTHKSYYSNLAKDTVKCKVGDKVSGGQVIGYIGDTTVSELADEPHLHFELKVSGASVNPLDYITDESKLVSLGITSGSAA
ncbi:MAG: M23 family metallopeptidase [Ruminococcaceae bacterium]|nr:M23 family metallopeptidase [Oscillospiraceae bacterium]